MANATFNRKILNDRKLIPILKKAEALSTKKCLIKVKWSKILSEGKRNCTKCFGPQFILQLSGSGLVAPCGMLFNDRYKKFHIGNIIDKPFKEIWQSKRYWDVMKLISSKKFNAKKTAVVYVCNIMSMGSFGILRKER